MNRKVKHN